MNRFLIKSSSLLVSVGVSTSGLINATNFTAGSERNSTNKTDFTVTERESDRTFAPGENFTFGSNGSTDCFGSDGVAVKDREEVIYKLITKEKIRAVLSAIFGVFVYFLVYKSIRFATSFLRFIFYRRSIKKAWLEAIDGKISFKESEKSQYLKMAEELAKEKVELETELRYAERDLESARAYFKKYQSYIRECESDRGEWFYWGIGFVRTLGDVYKSYVKSEVDEKNEQHEKIGKGPSSTVESVSASSHGMYDLEARIRSVDCNLEKFTNGVRKLRKRIINSNGLLGDAKRLAEVRRLRSEERMRAGSPLVKEATELAMRALKTTEKEIKRAKSYLKEYQSYIKERGSEREELFYWSIRFVKTLGSGYKSYVKAEFNKKREKIGDGSSSTVESTTNLIQDVNDLEDKIKSVEYDLKKFINRYEELNKEIISSDRLLSDATSYVLDLCLDSEYRVGYLAKSKIDICEKIGKNSNDIAKWENELEAIKDEKNAVSNRSFCWDLCAYLTQKQQRA